MLWVLHFTTIFTITIGTERPNSEEIFNINDWTPITREKVFGDINREHILHNNYAETLSQNLNDLAVNGNIFDNVGELLNKPRYEGYKRNWNSKRSFLEKIISGEDYNKEKLVQTETTTLSDGTGQRKAKVVSNKYYINDINNLAAENVLKRNYKFNKAPEKDDDFAINKYEVTESNEMELADEENNFINTKNTSLGFSESNNIFKINDDNENDLTKRFLSILSNYNIRVNDALPNYDLSRSSERKPLKYEYILLPIPVRFLSRFKLPVDSLPPLILSNYGYNLGRYNGLQGRHRAAYARSAFSDFYNNQFSGLYKTYSDTDSSQ